MALTLAQNKAIAFKAGARAKLKMNTREIAAAILKATKATIQQGVDLIAARAKQLVPVKSGRLRDSIRGRVRKARKEERLIGSVSTNTKGGVGAKGKPNRYGYGLDVEIGRPSGNYHATPYLRPALAQTKGKVLEVLKANVGVEVKKVAGRRGRPKK